MAWDCEDCVRRLDQMVDKELTDTDVKLIELHFEECGDCIKRYDFQQGLKRLIKVSCEGERAPDSLRARLREILQG